MGIVNHQPLPLTAGAQTQGLYDASHEHDACGVGMVVNIHGNKSHELVDNALKVLENMLAGLKICLNCPSSVVIMFSFLQRAILQIVLL